MTPAAAPRLAAGTDPADVPDPPAADVAPGRRDDSLLRSVSIAVAVLDCFETEPELGATRVFQMLGVAKSTASRILAALATGGLLERSGNGRYRLACGCSRSASWRWTG